MMKPNETEHRLKAGLRAYAGAPLIWQYTFRAGALAGKGSCGAVGRPEEGEAKMSKRPAAFVTGGRRGIGRAICWALADGGFDIVVNDVVEDEAVGDTLSGIEARGGQAMFLRGDIGDLAGQERWCAPAWDAFAGIDCLVNNAGVQVAVRGDLLEVTAESLGPRHRHQPARPLLPDQRIARADDRDAAAPGQAAGGGASSTSPR